MFGLSLESDELSRRKARHLTNPQPFHPMISAGPIDERTLDGSPQRSSSMNDRSLSPRLVASLSHLCYHANEKIKLSETRLQGASRHPRRVNFTLARHRLLAMKRLVRPRITSLSATLVEEGRRRDVSSRTTSKQMPSAPLAPLVSFSGMLSGIVCRKRAIGWPNLCRGSALTIFYDVYDYY